MKEVLTIDFLKRMNRTYKLRVAITSILKQVCASVYYRNSSKGAIYPYITYDLDHVKAENGNEYTLELHIWTRNIKECENIGDQLEELNDCYYTDNEMSFDMSLNNRNNIQDEDKELQHVRLLFNLSYYPKEA